MREQIKIKYKHNRMDCSTGQAGDIERYNSTKRHFRTIRLARLHIYGPRSRNIQVVVRTVAAYRLFIHAKL